MPTPFHIQAALGWAAGRLQGCSATPQLDAAVLLAWVLKSTRSALYARGSEPVAAAQWEQYQQLVERRRQGEPVAYLVQMREFYGLEFFVDQRVLVPRPETELLVERALDWLVKDDPPTLIADVGTGSGCIAVSLAVHGPQQHIYALDYSEAALVVAEINSGHHDVRERITLVHSDGAANLPEAVHMIVSNPPYTILKEIDQNVYDFEPHLALDGGADGLDVYRDWLPAFATHLRPERQGIVLLEIGAWQDEAISELAARVWPTATIQVWPDLAGHPRVVEIVVPPISDQQTLRSSR